MDEIGEEINRLITRLLILNDAVRDRLCAGDHEFASELAEAGEWELAIETVRKGSRDRLLLTGNERQELDDIETSLRRLEPAMHWRSFRELIRGALRAIMRGEKPSPPPAVEPMVLHPEPPFEPRLLTKAMPTVATWLQAGLRHDGEDLLAEQILTARVHALCECGDNCCFSFYLMSPISLDERRGRWTGLMPQGFESIGIDGGRIAWVQHEFRGPIDAVTDDGLRAIREYQSLIGVVPRAAF